MAGFQEARAKWLRSRASRYGVLAHADERDGVRGAVELAVTVPAETVAGDRSRGGLQRSHTGQFGEGSLGADPSWM
jgi:hypothetical protein